LGGVFTKWEKSFYPRAGWLRKGAGARGELQKKGAQSLRNKKEGEFLRFRVFIEWGGVQGTPWGQQGETTAGEPSEHHFGVGVSQ